MLIARQSDNVILYAGNVTLTPTETRGADWRDPNTTTANAYAIDAPTPEGFRGGWFVWDGSAAVLTIQGAAEKAAEEAAKLPPVPQVVTPRQARLALLAAGILPQVEAAIASGSDADRIAWEYALEIKRNDDMIINIGSALGLTSAQIDDLFRDAAGR